MTNYSNLKRLCVVGADNKFISHRQLWQLNGLTTLILQHRYVSKIPRWLKYLSRLQVLKLHLSGNKSPRTANTPVLKGIQACASTLRKLDIEFFCMFPNQIVADAAHCTCLTSLRLAYTRGKNSETCSVDDFAKVSVLERLRKLSLEGVAIAAVHIQRVANLTGLETLRVERSPYLKSDGVAAIVSSFTSLRRLSLKGSEMTPEVTQLFPRLSQLQELNIVQTNVHVGDTMARLKADLPQNAVAVVSLLRVTKVKYGDTFSVSFPGVPAWQWQSVFDRRRRSKLQLKQCDSCGRWETAPLIFPRCGYCKTKFYCNVECQKRDWLSKHKTQCTLEPATIPEMLKQ